MVEALTGCCWAPEDAADEKPKKLVGCLDDEVTASWVSLCQRRTTSRAIGRRWYDETRAADATAGFLSTMAVLMTRSTDWTVVD
jgi:anti-sigma factor RsiW